MSHRHSDLRLAACLVLAIALWGGNNVGTKWLMDFWPPAFTGSTRFLCAGFLLLGLIQHTKWIGPYRKPDQSTKAALWWRGGLSLAAYIVVFNYACRLTSAAHVALYLGAAPVWALIWEAAADRSRIGWSQWLAAALALSGVAVLVWPALRSADLNPSGELLGLATSILWTNYGRQSRLLSANLSGVAVSAHAMWRAGVWLIPVALLEIWQTPPTLSRNFLGVQSYCILAGGVMAFGLWHYTLVHWPTSRVFLFNNLIPVSTMTWAHLCLNEAITSNFLLALGLVATGVITGQIAGRSARNPTPIVT